MKLFYLFCKTLTFGKVKNFFSLMFQYCLSFWHESRQGGWREGLKLTARPVALSIEPVNICNLHCPECLTGSGQMLRKKGRISLGDFERIIDEVYKELCYLLLYFQGEPFLHPQFAELISYAKSKNIFVATSTNGHFLTEAGATAIVRSKLDYLIISMDGATQESYEKYRKGGKLSQVIAGIRMLQKVRKELRVGYPLIELQFIVFRHNEHEISRFKALAHELRVDKITVKPAQISYSPAEVFPPANARYSRYRQYEEGRFYLLAKNPRHCWRQWSSAVITWDGDMAPCCFDKEALYKYGNVNENGIYALWANEKANRFREMLSRGGVGEYMADICRQCPARL